MTFDSSDLSENRVKGGLGYLIFFLPLVLCPGSKYGKFCANQGLLVWIVLIALAVVSALLGWLPLIGWLVKLVVRIAEIAVGLLAIYLAYLACAKGDARALPGIGHVTLIK